ncbi:hypothetical protein, partial [Klebsiella michiganensis]|uniref:hypothetical protein n=1 Tax=Klebsiella michiganensis TaxID=1134687 RepID=UPI0025A1C5DB
PVDNFVNIFITTAKQSLIKSSINKLFLIYHFVIHSQFALITPWRLNVPCGYKIRKFFCSGKTRYLRYFLVKSASCAV